MAPAPARFAYVGSYTEGQPDAPAPAAPAGIAVVRVDPATGALSPFQTVPSRNPSFLALHPTLPVLYAVNEVADHDGAATGSVEAYALDPTTGGLGLLDRLPTSSAGPTHLAVDPAGRCIVVANYSGGTVDLFPIRPDGRPAPAAQTVTPTGSGPNPDRQEAPHPHGVAFDPAGRHVALADLGTDRISLFRLAPPVPPAGPPTGLPSVPSEAPPASPPSLVPIDEVATAPGAGPRHLAFHPSGRFLYAVNELIPSVAAYPYDPAAGTLAPSLQTLPTVPPDAAPGTAPAEVLVHPNGRLLVASNRRVADVPSPLADSIAPFALDPATGLLTPLPHATAGIANPRHLALDPTGTWLYASNQSTGTIVPFRLDPATGALTPVADPTRTPAPVCLVFGRA